MRKRQLKCETLRAPTSNVIWQFLVEDYYYDENNYLFDEKDRTNKYVLQKVLHRSNRPAYIEMKICGTLVDSVYYMDGHELVFGAII